MGFFLYSPVRQTTTILPCIPLVASQLQTLCKNLMQGAAVVFSSPCSGQNVEKHFKNLQLWLQKIKIDLDVTAESKSNMEDLKVNVKSDMIITLLL